MRDETILPAGKKNKPITGTITVTRVVPTDLDKSGAVSLTKGAKQWYSKKITESGLYKLELEATTNDFNVELINNDGSAAVDGNNGASLTTKTVDGNELLGPKKYEESFLLSKGDTLYVIAKDAAGAEESQTGTIKLTKVTPKDLTANAAPTDNITLGTSGEQWFYFDPLDTGVFTFTNYNVRDDGDAEQGAVTWAYSAFKRPDDENEGEYNYFYVNSEYSYDGIPVTIDDLTAAVKPVYYVKVVANGAPTDDHPWTGTMAVTTPKKINASNNYTAFTLEHRMFGGGTEGPLYTQQFMLEATDHQKFYTIGLTQDDDTQPYIVNSIKKQYWDEEYETWNDYYPGTENNVKRKNVTITLGSHTRLERCIVTISYDYTNSTDKTKNNTGKIRFAEGFDETTKPTELTVGADFSAFTVAKNSEAWFVFTPTVTSNHIITVDNTLDHGLSNVLSYSTAEEDLMKDGIVVGHETIYNQEGLNACPAATETPNTIHGAQRQLPVYVRFVNTDSTNDATGKIKVAK